MILIQFSAKSCLATISIFVKSHNLFINVNINYFYKVGFYTIIKL